MKTVLILAYECAPYNRPGATIGAQRPYQFAINLPDFGWKPIVLCCDINKRWELTPNSTNDYVKSIVQSYYTNIQSSQEVIIPLSSLKYSSRIDKLWLKLVKIDALTGSFSETKGWLKNYLRKIISIIKLFFGDYSQSWQKVAYETAIEINKINKIDIIIAEHSPDAGMFVASKLKDKLQIPWLIDFRDPILQPIPNVLRNLYVRFLRIKFKSVSCTINVNEYLKILDEELFNKPAYCITNGFDKQYPATSSTNNFLKVIYTGSIFTPFQKMELFIEAISLLKSKGYSNNDFIFEYYGHHSKEVKKYSIRHGVIEFIQLKNFVERDEISAKICDSDILLALGVFDKNNIFLKKGIVPGKVLDYLGYSKPILSVVKDYGMLDQLLKDTRSGIAISEPQEIAKFLETKVLEKRDKGKITWKFNQSAINQFSRKNQTKILAKLLDKYSML